MAGRADVWVGDKFTGIELVKAQKGKVVQGTALLFNERIAWPFRRAIPAC